MNIKVKKHWVLGSLFTSSWKGIFTSHLHLLTEGESVLSSASSVPKLVCPVQAVPALGFPGLHSGVAAWVAVAWEQKLSGTWGSPAS